MGELALLYFAPRAATITAKEASVVFVLRASNLSNLNNGSCKRASLVLEMDMLLLALSHQ